MWGFQFFHAAVVFGLGKINLFKYTLGHCEITSLKCWVNLWQSNFLCTPFYFTYCKKQTMKKRPSNWSRFSTFDFQRLIGVDCRHQASSRKVRSEWKKGSWPGGWYHLRSKEGTAKCFTRDIQILTKNLF